MGSVEDAYLTGDKRTEKVRIFFSSIYDKYDITNKIMTFGLDIYWRTVALSYISMGSNKSVLDIGTGTCDIPLYLIKKGFKGSITGIDITRDMLKVGYKKLYTNKKKVNLIEGNVFTLPFKDESFDYVISAYTFRNISPIDDAIAEVNRILKKSGLFILLEISIPTNEVIREIHKKVFLKVGPYIGGILSKNEEAYSYLPQSLLSFPARNEIIKKFYLAKFKNCRYRDCTLGTATVFLGNK
ncbi:MAG: ubiquinone/menaquinone biosynthesis methyltransferase [Candidatus Thermoplasmatota archaeon]|jgi:demethylmenaquinone methyltransferase/2-methoxy-6-polyprenyl-1,4-benzoquinol methylase|nr:ubiquinone/menaquinone biosynthesis methyltransferase [Candidatus Thermoplasmatota archaeon]MCL5963665.1 ubiquinone/menaquinone biosynthesis methyltransferase [Candidatus Thermoplasmatota archaeon]